MNDVFWKVKLEEKGKLQDFCESVQTTLDSPKFKTRFTAEDRSAIGAVLEEANRLLEMSIPSVSVNDFCECQAKLQGVYGKAVDVLRTEDKKKL